MVTLAGQYLIVEYGGSYTQTVPLTEDEWAMTVFLGALSIPLGFFMRLIPVSERESSFADGIKDTAGKAKKPASDLVGGVVNLVVAVIAILAMFIVQKGSGRGEPFDLAKIWG